MKTLEITFENAKRVYDEFSDCDDVRKILIILFGDIFKTTPIIEDDHFTAFGKRFMHTSGSIYIVARIGIELGALISLKNGNMWEDGVKISHYPHVSRKEFTKMCGRSGPSAFTAIDP